MSALRTYWSGWLVALALLLLGLSASAAQAQASASAHTYGTRYDGLGRVVGTLAPDPDGAGALQFAATRTSYDARSLPWKVESGELASWQGDEIAPSAWTGFTVLSWVESSYDANRRKIMEVVKGSDGVPVSVTQYSYDGFGRLECTAVRMNPATYGNLPASACTLGAEGSDGPDRITRNVYDAAGQLLKVQKAVGTSIQQDYVTYTYTTNGQQKTVKDANGNLATYDYDGHDRLVAWRFPNKANGTASASCNIGTIAEVNGVTGPADARGAGDDCEKYSYDRNGNRARLVKRDGTVLAYSYDALNRMTVKDVDATNVRPGLAATHKRDVYIGYDNRGLQTYARFDSHSGEGVATAYDGFGRTMSSSINMDGTPRTLTYSRNKNGNRTQLGWMDGLFTSYDYDGLDRMVTLYEGGLGSTLGRIGYKYNARGAKRRQIGGSNAALTDLVFDPVGRISSITHNMAGTTNDVTYGLDAYNPASQVTQRSTSNDSYVWTNAVNVNRAYTVNGLNQYESAGPAVFGYDGNGNLTSDGTNGFVYDVENRLVSRTGATTASLRYDPLGRLYEVAGSSGTTRFLHDGDELVAEYDGSTGALLRRYLHGLSVDDPVLAYEGAGLSQPRLLYANHQGSIIAVSDIAGAVTAKNSYDDWGIPGAANAAIAAGGRFSYTGQVWIPELGMYYYKARIYSPTLGRFMQTDPVGYEDGMNIYAYVGNDPVNLVDPTGRTREKKDQTTLIAAAIVAAKIVVQKRAPANKKATNNNGGMSGNAMQQGGQIIGSVAAVRKIGDPAVENLGKVAMARTAKVAVKAVPVAGEAFAIGLEHQGQVANGKDPFVAGVNTTAQVASTGLAGAAAGLAASIGTANPYIIGAATAAGAIGFDLSGMADAVGERAENAAMALTVAYTGQPPY